MAVGAAAIANATAGPGASSPSSAAATADSGSSSSSSITPSASGNSGSGGSSSTTAPSTTPGPRIAGPRFGPGGFGFGGGFLGGAGGAAGAIYGQYTIKGPNGYETIATRTGTVSSVTDTSGSTWTLVVQSADGTSGTFTVDSGTSVNGGEMGIGSVNKGDDVSVVGVVSGDTTTAKEVIDQTTLKSNGTSWLPPRPQPLQNGSNGSTGNSGTSNGGTTSS